MFCVGIGYDMPHAGMDYGMLRLGPMELLNRSGFAAAVLATWVKPARPGQLQHATERTRTSFSTHETSPSSEPCAIHAFLAGPAFKAHKALWTLQLSLIRTLLSLLFGHTQNLIEGSWANVEHLVSPKHSFLAGSVTNLRKPDAES